MAPLDGLDVLHAGHGAPHLHERPCVALGVGACQGPAQRSLQRGQLHGVARRHHGAEVLEELLVEQAVGRRVLHGVPQRLGQPARIVHGAHALRVYRPPVRVHGKADAQYARRARGSRLEGA